MFKRPHVTLDFESRSACDIKAGAWRYASDPTTDVMMLAFAVGKEHPSIWWGPNIAQPAIYGEPYKAGPNKGLPRLLVPAIEVPTPELDGITGMPKCPLPLLYAINDGETLFEAHNAEFERAMWRKICHEKWGWPDIPLRRWRCSAAKAASYALPRDLERLARVLKVKNQKDMEGSQALKALYKPRKPTKDNPRVWPGDTATFWRCAEYNIGDVLAERDCSDELPDLPAFEWEIWFVDQEINERGVLIDVELAERAMALAAEAKEAMNAELRELTGDPTITGGARDRVREHLGLVYKVLYDMQGKTLDDCLEDPEISSHARRVIELVRDINRTTTSKFSAAVDRCAEDGRAKSNLMFHGANTGRWSGKGLQLHNLKRPGKPLPAFATAKGKLDMDKLAAAIKTMSVEELMALADMPINFLSDVIRGLIIASKGYELAVGDYAAVEARGVMWLADCEPALAIFAANEDIYLDMASSIYRRQITKADELERQLGKQSILGLGYGMGAVKFLETCAGYGIYFTEEMARNLVPPDDYAELEELFLQPREAAIYAPGYFISEKTLPPLILAKYIVDRYRGRYAEVKQVWKDVEAAAIKALQNPGTWVPCCNRKIHYKKVGNFLLCRLPSGRFLSYPFAYLKNEKTKFTGKDGAAIWKPTIRYMAIDGLTKQWGPTHTYGGALVENIVQALCRDLMAYAMVMCYRTGKYFPVLTVHDELMAEVPKGQGDKDEFEQIMELLPEWAAGFPIKAEAFITERYRK